MKRSEQQFRPLLRGVGLKATPARVAVLALLEKSAKPLSIKDIEQSISKNEVDPATLYRMMNSLLELGIVRTVNFQHNHAHYELATQQHHHHLICKHCGKVVDLSKCDIKALEQEAKRVGKFASIDSHSIELYGICQACAKKTKKAS